VNTSLNLYTRYSAKGTKGKWIYASSKARLKSATYPRSQYIVMWTVDRFKRYGSYSGRVKLFLDQSIGIDGTNTFQLKFLSSMKIVGATGLGGLWALHISVTNLRCGYGIQIWNPNSLSFIVSEISAFIFTIFWSLWAVCGL